MSAMPIQKGFATRPMVTAEDQDKKLKEVGELYEKHFLRELVKSMRTTVPKSGFIQESQAEKIFSEKLDEEYVEQWGKQGGIGLGKLIYKQLVERFGEQMGITPAMGRIRGPVALPPQNSSSVGFRSVPQAGGNSVKLLMKDLDGQDRSVVSPWDGVLSRVDQDGDNSVLTIDHENGFKSELKFPGKFLQGVSGRVSAGQTVGQWTSAKSDLEWRVINESRELTPQLVLGPSDQESHIE